eukprot:165286-Prymnesium_polylepis.2
MARTLTPLSPQVEPSFWAPIGSALPERCPGSGFFCPGRAYDSVNELPGSLPIPLSSSGLTMTSVEEVQ